MRNKSTKKTQSLLFASLFTALICILAQTYIPTPICPISLQTFAVALCGYFLSVKASLLSTLAYILLGIIGAPVFSGFSGGIQHITGANGGFIFGFLALSLFCGISNTRKTARGKIGFSIIGLSICYILGIIQFCLITNTPVFNYFNFIFLLLFVKDILLCISAFKICDILRKRIKKN